MANFKIDHFVFGANTLSEGSNTIKKVLDEDLSEINVHETMGTHNRVTVSYTHLTLPTSVTV